jgi:hypothetical protein
MKKCRCDECKKARADAKHSLSDLLESAQSSRLSITEHKATEKKVLQSAIEEALQGVGYQPRVMCMQESQAVTALLEKAIDEVLAPITRPVRVQVQKAGGYVKVRYAGHRICCFGKTPEHAIENLKVLHKMR